MRGMVGRLCHGGERKPLEPYGTWAPFLRMVAAGTTFAGAGAGLAAVGLYLRAADDAVILAAQVTVTLFSAGGVLRVFAAFTRPDEVPLTVPANEVRP